MNEIYHRQVEFMGMPITQFKYRGAIAEVAVEEEWATIYSCHSENPGKGEMQHLLIWLKAKFSDRKFGGTVALNPTMKHIYEKLKIKEYNE